MDDLISRQAAIDAVNDVIVDYIPIMYGRFGEIPLELALAIERLPTADLSEYSDKLWKTAYERGKAEAHPKKGSWDVRYDEEYAEDGIVICSECGEIYTNENFYWYKAHYCPNCGCRMTEGEEDDRE